MLHYTSPSSPAPMRSTILWELASIKESTREGAWQAFLTLRDEHHFEYFQRDLFMIAKSHNVSEVLDPTFTPGPSQEEKELYEAKETFMYKVFKETPLTDMGRNKVRMHHRTTDAQAVWKEYSEYITTASWQVMVVNPNPQHNCEDQKTTDDPSTVPTTIQATSVYSTWHLSSAEDKNFPFCPQLRTQKTYGKQMLLSKPSIMAYLTMVVLPSWQLLTQYYTNCHEITKTNRLLVGF